MIIETQLIPGLSNTATVGLFAIGTTLFLVSMASFYKKLKAKKKAQPETSTQ